MVMFGKKEEKEPTAIEKEMADIDVKLKTLDPHTQGAEYEQLLRIRGQLKDQLDCEEELLSKLDPNVIVKLVGTFGVAILIMVFESAGHIFTSKASSFMPRIM